MKSLALVLLGLLVGAVLGFVAGNGKRDGAFPAEITVAGPDG